MKNVLNKISYVQLLLDLIIVFIGVSLAFVFTNYQEQQKEKKQTEQVLSLLDTGLSLYEQLFEGFVSYHKNYNVEFRNKLNNNDIPNLEGILYPSPAYPIDAISLLTNQGYQILGPAIYVKLTEFSNAIKRLSYIEQKLVGISEKSMEINIDYFKTSKSYEEELKKWGRQYLLYLEIRKNTLNELLRKSNDLRVLLKEVYPKKAIKR